MEEPVLAIKANDTKELRLLRDEKHWLTRTRADPEPQTEMINDMSRGTVWARLGAGQQYCT